MEVFKTAIGSWIYPEAVFLRIGGVPLFSGFMYAAVGSYIARIWRISTSASPTPAALGDPPCSRSASTSISSRITGCRTCAICCSPATAAIFWRTRVWFKPFRRYRRDADPARLPARRAFIWFAENIGTLSRAWIYPNQRHGWEMVPLAKLGSWYLLMIISFVLVALVRRPEPMDEHASNA